MYALMYISLMRKLPFSSVVATYSLGPVFFAPPPPMSMGSFFSARTVRPTAGLPSASSTVPETQARFFDGLAGPLSAAEGAVVGPVVGPVEGWPAPGAARSVLPVGPTVVVTTSASSTSRNGVIDRMFLYLRWWGVIAVGA